MKIVYVTGKAGVGKTYFSKELQERYGWKRFEIDALTKISWGLNYPEKEDNIPFVDLFIRKILPEVIESGDVLIVDHLITIKPEHRKRFEVLNPEEEVMVIIDHKDHEERYKKGYRRKIPTKGYWYNIHIVPMEEEHELTEKVWYIKNDEDAEKVTRELGEYLS
jgi:tRNA uridine 5-carbamoylmethylation protein Kti12